MAVIGISEFTFGYAFLYEQTHRNWAGLRAAPILPSLQQEQHAGWDAHLPLNGLDFYYQFKLSEHLSRSNASFIADGTYTSPYYRLTLHRRHDNQQHRRLREHAKVNPHTYYVAPEFQTLGDFNSAFLNRQITDRSRIIPVADCDDVVDGEQHYLTFQPGRADWIQHSEKRRKQRSFFGADLEAMYRETHSQWRRIDRNFGQELFHKTEEIVKKMIQHEERAYKAEAMPLLDFNPAQSETRRIFERTSEVLSVFLGVTLVIVGAGDRAAA